MAVAEQRQQFLHSTEDPDPDDFIRFMQLHLDKNEAFNAVETLQTFDRKSLDQLWNGLQNLATTVLFGFNEQEDLNSQKEQIKQATRTIEGVLILSQATLDNNTNELPDGFFQTSIILHNMMNMLPDSMDHTKDGIAKLCEQWWTSEVEGCEELISQTILYLLQRGSDPKVKIVHIKRIWSVRTALGKFNFENKSFIQMKDLILRCCIPATFVKSEEGRKFLTFLFSLNLKFVDELHEVIKTQLPHCPRSLLESYGKIYFNAWKTSSGDFLEKIERDCIQDLMFRAVHALRSPAKNMALIIRTVVGYFTMQKKHPGVEEMLQRLTSPIIWRSLQVVNANVRANATSLLIEMFPLRETDVKLNEELLQKQLAALQRLLNDSCPDVRSIAVYGVCKICSTYWELIPAATVTSYMTSLIQDSVYDGASADVRVAVFRGFAHLLDNYLSHPLLKQLLPRLQDFIHDPSEKVRIAVIDMLFKVHSIRGIKVWSVVPMEHLLVRLEHDSPSVLRRIVRLIFPSFVPVDKTDDSLLKRCLALLQTNPRAARVFYQYSLKHMAVKTVERYLILVTRCVASCVQKELAKDNADSSEESTDQDDEVNDLTIEDTDMLCGLMETITILYAGIIPELSKPINASSKTILENKFGKVLPDFFRVLKDAKILSPLCLLAGFMPPNMVPKYSRSCVSKLRNFEEGATAVEFGPLLEAMCNWGKAGDVLELVTDWLKQTFKPNRQKVSKKTKQKKVSFSKETLVAKPGLGLKFLDYMLSQPLCQQRILEGNRPEINQLKAVLKDTMVHIEQFVVKPPEDKDSPITAAILQTAFDFYCKIVILTHEQTEWEGTSEVIESFENILTWVDREILPTLEGREKQSNNRKRKRNSNKVDQELNANTLTKTVIKGLMNICNDLLLVGLATAPFAVLLAEIIEKIAQTEVSVEYIDVLVKTMYQIIEANMVADWNLTVTEIPQLFTVTTTALLNITMRNPESSAEVINLIKPALTEATKTYFTHHHSLNSTNNDVMATILVTAVNETTNRVKSENEVATDSLLPPVTALFLDIVVQDAYTLGLLLQEIYHCTNSEALDGLRYLAGLVQVLQAIVKNKAEVTGIKDCLSSVQVQFDKIEQPNPEDLITIDIYESTKSILRECCNSIGMVN